MKGDPARSLRRAIRRRRLRLLKKDGLQTNLVARERVEEELGRLQEVLANMTIPPAKQRKQRAVWIPALSTA